MHLEEDRPYLHGDIVGLARWPAQLLHHCALARPGAPGAGQGRPPARTDEQEMHWVRPGARRGSWRSRGRRAPRRGRASLGQPSKALGPRLGGQGRPGHGLAPGRPVASNQRQGRRPDPAEPDFPLQSPIQSPMGGRRPGGGAALGQRDSGAGARPARAGGLDWTTRLSRHHRAQGGPR